MRLLAIFLFFVASALAVDNTNYNGKPMDYFDSYNPNLKVRPDSTFSFNFEQTRRNQPPQIEMREENVNRYFHGRPQTTTLLPILPMKVDRDAQNVYPVMNNKYIEPQRQWAPPPPPPTLDFSRHNNDAKLHGNPPPAWSGPPVLQNVQQPNFTPQLRNVPTPPLHPAQLAQPQKPLSTSPYYPPNPPKAPTGVSFAPSASYVSDSISAPRQPAPRQPAPSQPAPRQSAPRQPAPRQPAPLPNRGSHKFSWDDIKKPEDLKPIMNNPQPLPAQPSAPQSIHNKSPPPVPTLSPWYDNFGK